MKILIFAPHNDDEILGCGGTIAKYIKAGNQVYVCEVTKGKMYETLQEEALSAHRMLGVTETFFLNLPVVQLRNLNQGDINSAMGEVVKKVNPDIAYIPHRGDMHIDHEETAGAAMVALRPVNCPELRAIYAYETLSETEWNIPAVDNAFIPNVWVDISETIEDKIRAMRCYQSQIKEFPNPRSVKAIRSLSEFRGSTVCTHNAECFMLIREIQK